MDMDAIMRAVTELRPDRSYSGTLRGAILLHHTLTMTDRNADASPFAVGSYWDVREAILPFDRAVRGEQGLLGAIAEPRLWERV